MEKMNSLTFIWLATYRINNWFNGKHSGKRLVSTFALIVSGLNKIAKVADEIHQNNVNNTIWEFLSTVTVHRVFIKIGESSIFKCFLRQSPISVGEIHLLYTDSRDEACRDRELKKRTGGRGSVNLLLNSKASYQCLHTGSTSSIHKVKASTHKSRFDQFNLGYCMLHRMTIRVDFHVH